MSIESGLKLIIMTYYVLYIRLKLNTMHQESVSCQSLLVRHAVQSGSAVGTPY